MANVIQTKKKRDKKKKKEDGNEEFVFLQPTPIPTPVDDLNIHVDKEATTGGGLCAKLVFFVLLTVLSTLIGLILTEHRGLTDLDTINTESAFARIFEGWVDKAPEEHEESFSVEHSHEEEDDEVEPSNSQDEEEDDEEDAHSAISEEQEVSKTESEEPEDDDDTIEQDEDEEEEEDTAEASTEKDETLETIEEESKASASVVSQDEPEEEEDHDFQEQITQRIEKSRETSSTSKEILQTLENIDEEEEIVQLDKVEPEIVQEVKIEKAEDGGEQTPDNVADEAEKESSSMVVRFGVGAALLVVAHVVLIRKWRTARNIIQENPDDVKYTSADLSRRDTLIPPPTLDEIGQDFEHVEEDYSEDEEPEEEEEEEDYDNGRHAPLISPVARTKYQELRSTYSHNLSPDWEPRRIVTNSDEENEDEDEEEDDEGGYDDEEEDEVEPPEEENDEISENEDEELLRRLEAKYGILRQSEPQDQDVDDEEDEQEEEDEEEDVEEEEDFEEEDGSRQFDHWKRERIKPVGTDSDSEDENWTSKRSGANSVYEFSNITNVDDMKIRKELDRAEQNLANGAAFALTLFNKILEKHPVSPRALYGKSKSLDALAEEKKSNKFLEEAITTYQKILKFNDVPDVLFQVVAERCINRMRFRGFYVQAVPIHKLLISRFPENVHFQNELAVTYLTMNNFYDAKKVLYDILSKWPDNGFAMVNYGFILKLYDLDLKEAVKFLKKGLETKDPGVIDGRFYYHLGDALIRLGRKDEAMEVHIDGVKNNVFLSKYQRSLHNVNGLLGKPWWKTEDIPDKQFFDKLEQNWKIIRDEGLKLLDTGGLFKMESEDLREVGDWKQFELYARGIKNVKNCRQCPKTCQIIESFPDAIGCKRGQIKFSVVQPGTHVWPHCGPTNCRLRSHLGLKVPSNVFIRVADEIRSWKDGQILIFDDSFEHEIWHNGSSTRLILIVDFWHPQLSKQEKRSLSSV